MIEYLSSPFTGPEIVLLTIIAAIIWRMAER